MNWKAAIAIKNRFVQYAKDENAKPDEHGRYGASQMNRIFNCPGSVLLNESIKEAVEPSVYAITGTAAMRLIQYILAEEKSQPDDDYYTAFERCVVPVGKKMAILGEEDLSAIKVCIDTVADYLRNELDMTIRDAVKKGYLFIERSFSLTDIDPECYGRCDILIYIPFEHLVIFDYKHGAGVGVKVEENKQCKMYALGALTTGQYDDIDDVKIGIIQPRCTLVPDVAYFDVTRDELMKFKEEMRAVIKATKTKGADYKMGDWCIFCKANATGRCPVKRGAVIEVMKDVIEPIFPDPNVFTDEQLGKFITYGKAIDDYLKAVRNRATDRATKGYKLPGCKLVRGEKREKFESDTEALMEEKFGRIPEEFLNEPKMKTPKQCRAEAKKCGMGDEYLEFIDANAVTPEGEPILVLETDKRPAIDNASVVEVFGNESKEEFEM